MGSVEETTQIRHHAYYVANEDAVNFLIVRDHIFRDSETTELLGDRCYSERLNHRGEWERYKQFEIIEPTFRIPGNVAYELVRVGWTKPIEDQLREILKRVIDEGS